MEDVEPGIASRRVLYFPDVSGFMVYADVEAYRFSPDGNKIFILYDVYSEYYEYSLRLETYLWDLETGIQYEFGELEGVSGSLTPRLVWSPDGNRVFFFLTDLTAEGEYQINIYQTDLLTGERLSLYAENILSDENYIYLTNLYWRE
jgi:Tol biopolymer transport system component